MTTHGVVAGSMRETIERLRAEVARLKSAELDALCQAREAEAEVERLKGRVECVWCGWTWAKPDAPDRHECSRNPLVVQRDTLACEVAALRSGLAIESALGLLRRLVDGIDKWNASVTPIIGRPVDYKWPALEEARAAIAPEVKP